MTCTRSATNLVPAEIIGPDARCTLTLRTPSLRTPTLRTPTLRTPTGNAMIQQPAPRTGAVLLAVQPERLRLAALGTDLHEVNAWDARIRQINDLGARLHVALHVPQGGELTADLLNNKAFTFRQGEKTVVAFDPEDPRLIPA